MVDTHRAGLPLQSLPRKMSPFNRFIEERGLVLVAYPFQATTTRLMNPEQEHNIQVLIGGIERGEWMNFRGESCMRRWDTHGQDLAIYFFKTL